MNIIEQSAPQKVSDATEAFLTTIKSVLNNGTEIQAAPSNSVGSGKKSKEIINFHLIVENPKQRLLDSKVSKFNLPGAVARFVWMMAANNRLADIAFYWGMEKMSYFSDDGYTIPGSSYGSRMFNASPGLDQIKAVIKRLQEDHSTRRAAVAIYHPVDAVRESHDIPCTFGLFYHIRENVLISTIVMRSNNAFILLPYNIFEFSLLAEVIAREVGVEVGPIYYTALSMHIYENNYELANKISKVDYKSNNIEFPSMPSTPTPLGEIKKLIKLEAELRHNTFDINNSTIDKWLSDKITLKGESEPLILHSYWRQFYYLLLYHVVLEKIQDKESLKKVADLIDEPFKAFLSPEGYKIEPHSIQRDLFGDPVSNPDYLFYSHSVRKIKSFESLCENHNKIHANDGKTITLPLYMKLREKLVGSIDDLRKIAARGDSSEVSQNDFNKALREELGDD